MFELNFYLTGFFSYFSLFLGIIILQNIIFTYAHEEDFMPKKYWFGLFAIVLILLFAYNGSLLITDNVELLKKWWRVAIGCHHKFMVIIGMISQSCFIG